MNEWHDDDLTAMMMLARQYPELGYDEIRNIVANGEYQPDGSLAVRIPPKADRIEINIVKEIK